jgi:hypothetical protein
MIPAFERAKTVHALDRAANVIGHDFNYLTQNVFGLPVNAGFYGVF